MQGKGIFVPPPLVQTVEKIVEVLKIEYIEVPKVQIIEKVVEIEVEKIVENTVEVVKVVDESLAKPVADFAAQAVERTIAKEVALCAPESLHRLEFNAKVSAHEAKHPNGTLPMELRCFAKYMRGLQEDLDHAQQAQMKCLSCGRFPWT